MLNYVKFLFVSLVVLGCGSENPQRPTTLPVPVILEAIAMNVDWVNFKIQTNVERGRGGDFFVALYKADEDWGEFEPYRRCWDFEGDGVSECAVGDLTEESSYRFKGRNCPKEEILKVELDESKCSSFSETVTVTMPSVKLNAPTDLRVTLEYTVEEDGFFYLAVEIAWDDASFGVDGYFLESAYDEAGPWSYHGAVDGSQREMSVLYLETDTTYWLRLRSFHRDLLGRFQYSDYSAATEYTTSP